MVTIVREVSDLIDVGDNTFYYTRNLRDTTAVSESITSGLVHKRTVQDIITLSQSLVRRLVLKRLVQNTTSTSESIRRAGTEITYTRSISDVITLLQSIIAIKLEGMLTIHPEQPFYKHRERSRFRRRFEYMRL
jgi:hypothetical protein